MRTPTTIPATPKPSLAGAVSGVSAGTLRTWAAPRSLIRPPADLADEAIVYLWDDFTVVKTPVSSETGLLWDQVTPDWQEFCQVMLGFEIPEDLRYAYEKSKGQDVVPAEVVGAQNQNGA